MLRVIHEDNHLLVIDKPAGLATMGAEEGEPTLHCDAADYLRQKYGKPGRVFVGVVSRLDSMTTGVIVLARTSKAASRLTPQFAAKDGTGAQKIYLAAVEGNLDDDRQVWTDFVRKDDRARRMRVVGPTIADAQEARLQYLTIAQAENVSFVAVRLLSGRKHQIRVQFADRGHPVMGDRKYGSKQNFSEGIALHSWRLRFEHPTLRQSCWYEAALPKSWRPWRQRLPPAGKLWLQVKKEFQMPDDDES